MIPHRNRWNFCLSVPIALAVYVPLFVATATATDGSSDDATTAPSETNGDVAALVDPTLPPYRPVSGVSGSIKSVGSDTMNNLMTLWAEGFKRSYPNVQAEIEGKGSSTAPPGYCGDRHVRANESRYEVERGRRL